MHSLNMTNEFAHLSYLLLFLGFLFRESRWTKASLISGSAAGAAYSFFATGGPFYIPFFWYSLFVLVNIFSLIRFESVKKSLDMDPVETFLKKGPLSIFDGPEIKSFLRIGLEGSVPKGEVLLTRGNSNQELYCVLRGEFLLSVGSQQIAKVQPGGLIGYKCFLGEPESDVDVSAINDAIVMSWSLEKIEEWVGSNTRRMALMQALVGWQHIDSELAVSNLK